MILALSRRIQRVAQKQAVVIGFTNAMGFGFITGQTIYLIALMYGADDTQMGFFYAAPFVSTLAALLVPTLLNGKETTAIWSRFWFLRVIFCLLYFVLPWWRGSADGRVWLFLFLYYLFMVARSFGMGGYFTVFRALAPPKENSSLMARCHMAGQIGVLIATTLSFVVMFYNAVGTEERNLFLLVAIGLTFNAITAWKISRLPKTGYLEDGSMRSLGAAALQMLRTHAYREVALVVALHAALSVFGGYLISYLRNVMGYSGGAIFLFTVLGVLGAIGITNLLKMIGSRVQPRVVLFAGHGAMAVLALFWALAPVESGLGRNPVWVAVLYALTVVCLTVSTTVSLQLRTGRLPQHKSVELSIIFDMMQVAGAVAALGCTSLLAHVPLTGVEARLHPYSVHFLLWALTSFLVCVLAVRMRAQSTGGFLQECSALLPSNIFTIIRVHRLDQDENTVRRNLSLEGLLMTPNQVSRELILENLRSPDTSTRASCIRVLTGYPLDTAVPLLVQEAASRFSPLRREAITALGFSGRKDLLPVLDKIWHDAPAELRATLVKSILRLGGRLSDDEILAVWESSPRPQRMDILIGLAGQVGRTDLLFHLLGLELESRPDPYGSQPLLGFVAASINRRASLFDVFSEEAERSGSGIAYITANLEGGWPEGLDAETCQRLIRTSQFDELTRMMRKVCDESWVLAYDRTTALGVLFLLLLKLNGAFEPLQGDDGNA